MAMAVTAQVLEEGQRNLIMLFTGVGDGSGDESLVTKVDVSALNPPCKAVKVKRLTYDVAYGAVTLLWDALVPVEFAALDGHDTIDAEPYGGIINKGGPSATGDILLSTAGFELNSTYTLILEMVKKGVGE